MVDLLISGSDQYWVARFLFYRGLYLTYFLAFLAVYRQFLPLAGEEGILPFTDLIERSSFRETPSVFHFFPNDEAVRQVSVAGLILSGIGFLGVEWLGTVVTSLVLLVLWALYLSLVKVGRLFYGYGWESFLCETGVLAVFLGGAYQEVPDLVLVLFAWLLFRVMFGAGLIKIRGDRCWRNLTCMDYHYETQPMPNPLSWFAHHLPRWWHKLEVAANHLVELVVPFLYFVPQPAAGFAGLLTIGFQGWLMLTGNFSWLNFLTAVVALPLIPDWFYSDAFGWLAPAGLHEMYPVHGWVIVLFGLLVLILSYYPARNLLSENQLMNAGFDPLNLVNTYGAFGSITRNRYELVVEGRCRDGEWKTYEFKGKPTDPERCPPQWAPYHLRLDWQLWFAAMKRRPPGWLFGMMEKLLENEETFSQLLRTNPFAGEPGPEEIRIQRYRYEFTDPGELWNSGRWWKREYIQTVASSSDGSGATMNR